MGEVYQARDTELGRDVGLKVLPDVFTSDSDRLAAFGPGGGQAPCRGTEGTTFVGQYRGHYFVHVVGAPEQPAARERT
ncbi:MAG: hypothetical protein CL477_08770 [Acidobacteria bacterium]|nr:hypothetical protein [Acidobacteriota bacterium]